MRCDEQVFLFYGWGVGIDGEPFYLIGVGYGEIEDGFFAVEVWQRDV